MCKIFNFKFFLKQKKKSPIRTTIIWAPNNNCYNEPQILFSSYRGRLKTWINPSSAGKTIFPSLYPNSIFPLLSGSKLTHFPSPSSNNVTVNYQLLEYKQA